MNMKIQKRNSEGPWVDFITIHSRGLGEEYRIISDDPAPDPADSLLLSVIRERGKPDEIIDLIVQISSAIQEFRRLHDSLPDDRVGDVMEDIGFDRIESLAPAERKLMIALAMLGFDAAMLCAEALD